MWSGGEFRGRKQGRSDLFLSGGLGFEAGKEHRDHSGCASCDKLRGKSYSFSARNVPAREVDGDGRQASDRLSAQHHAVARRAAGCDRARQGRLS